MIKSMEGEGDRGMRTPWDEPIDLKKIFPPKGRKDILMAKELG